ncbi:MAG: peptidase [Gammaproteobacteria bacterium]|nr:MAG: peptidase [Gammaproteobacteria bacterium]
MLAKSPLGLLLGFCAAAFAAELDLRQAPWQGGVLIARVSPANTVVEYAGRRLRTTPEGWFLVGLGRDAPERIELILREAGGGVRSRPVPVRRRAYTEQRIDGLPPRQVEPDAAALERIRVEQRRIDAARAAADRPGGDFLSGFDWPAAGRISGVYGSRRVLNGAPRRPHAGVDIAAPEGSPVYAPAPGVVRLAERDLFFTGGTVILDHGHGLTTLYAHLSRVDVEVGRRLARGERLGAVGATGRATGPHLHWGANWFGERLDPSLLVRPLEPARIGERVAPARRP